MKRINYTIKSSSHVLPWLSCHDRAMILTRVPRIMICHDLDKVTMVNHDLARLTMIMVSVPLLRTLGNHRRWNWNYFTLIWLLSTSDHNSITKCPECFLYFFQAILKICKEAFYWLYVILSIMFTRKPHQLVLNRKRTDQKTIFRRVRSKVAYLQLNNVVKTTHCYWVQLTSSTRWNPQFTWFLSAIRIFSIEKSDWMFRKNKVMKKVF